MSRAVLLTVAPSSRQWRVVFARVQQVVGWAGLAGCMLLVVAAWVGQRAWLVHRAVRLEAAASAAAPLKPVPMTAAASGATEVGRGPALISPFQLPPAHDSPLLIARIERAALAAGLAWTAAEYRSVPRTDAQAASLEVRCTFKAPYPKLRAMVAEVLASVPASTFREVSFTRPNADTADVEGKMVIAVYLADESTAAATVSRP